jgi:hypothetical protein
VLKQLPEGIYIKLDVAHPVTFCFAFQRNNINNINNINNKNRFSRAQLLFSSFVYKNTAFYFVYVKTIARLYSKARGGIHHV